MDEVLPAGDTSDKNNALPPAPRMPRRDSIQCEELSVESDVTYQSLEDGDILAMVGRPLPLDGDELELPGTSELLTARSGNGGGGGSTQSLVSVAETVMSIGSGPVSPTSMLPETNARVVYVNDAAKNAAAGFCDNVVVTAKYTKLNFIPRFFYGRLSQVANFYFLLVGAGQLIPAISSTAGLPYQWMVLTIVLSIDAVFAAIEDAARHRADAKMNARTTQVFDPSSATSFREVTWSSVRVGDFLKVCNYEALPADVLLLAVSETDPDAPSGICFIETKSLDGETNLKVRQALTCTYSQLRDARNLGQLPGRVICERPNHDVNNFSGRFEPQAGHTIPVDLKSIALRGCVIRNTPFVYGLVINTGGDTKIMQSSSETPSKVSKILSIVNRGIGILMAILVALCVLGAVLCSAWVASNYSRATYLMLHDLRGSTPFHNDVVGWIIYVGYYWILIASFVPITLYVTIAIVKSYQTFFLNRDLQMYDPVTDTPALVRNADLNDDLGQVTHIFSDKTGTLTANEMDFRKMSINGVSYGRGTTEIGREAVRRLGKDLSESDLLADSTPIDAKEENVRFIDPASEYLRDSDARAHPVQAAWIEAFLTHLAVCHSVVLEQSDAGDGSTKFSASSPDELALVAGANFFGYAFKARTNGFVMIRVPSTSPSFSPRDVQFELLEMIDFTSTRKRMSVVVRTPEQHVLLLTKGADAVIFPRLDLERCDPHVVDVTNQHLERYATEGLRTLVIAQKEIPSDAFDAWSREYKAALSDLEQVKLQKAGEPNRIEDLEEALEMGLELLGATAIEDRLQDDVTSTIADLARAGIKIWILTGDKEETAINIGFACQLLNNDMERLIINAETFPTSAALYEMLLLRCKASRQQRVKGNSSSRNNNNSSRSQAIVIDGTSLAMVFSHHALCDVFLEVSQHCAAVICCRVSPKQKAQVVRLYKTNIQGCRSLAIGDGANDVGMIQEAHIGIGISGHEGMQAVNSSDFAIAQFRFLKRLLLVHGHWNYRRMAKLAVYVVYKNIILYSAAFVLATISGGSGTLYFNNMWVNGYNVFWTSLPIVVVGVLEQECPAHVAETFPGLYFAGAQGEHFSLRIFAAWIVEGLYEGVVCALVPAFLVGAVDSHGNGYSRDVCGGLSYCCLITVGWFKLALNIVTWNVITIAGFVGSLAFWYFAGWIMSVYFPIFASDYAFPYAYSLVEFYLVLYVTLVLCLGRDFLYKATKRELWPEYYHILQEVHRRHLSVETAQWTPPELQYTPFRADLRDAMPLLLPLDRRDVVSPVAGATGATTAATTSSSSSSVNVGERQRAYTGFAFSTQVLEDRFVNPLRELVLPVRSKIATAMGQRRVGTMMTQATAQATTSKASRDSDDIVKSFEDRVLELPLADQAIYEIQRFQIFTGWGSSFPGHLFASDPPRFTNADMTDGAATFDLSDWMIDNTFGGGSGGQNDQWEYATKFKDYLRSPATATAATATVTTAERATSPTDRRRLKKKLNKLVGRCVRRRRWVRKDKLLSDIVLATELQQQ